MNAQSTLSVVIPVFNEEETLDELIQRTLAVCRAMKRPFEIILVDDGSRDRSVDIISQASIANPAEIICVILNRNYGQHSAVVAGFAQSKGDIIVTLDADLQNPPEEITRLVQKMDEGLDVVGGIRTPRCDTLFRRLASFFINKLTAKVTGVHMHDYGCMLRAYRRHIVQAILQCQERSTFVPVLANTFARRTMEISVRHEKRQAGTSKYSLWKLINLQFDLLTSMTTFPLRIVSIIGVAISVLGMGFGMLILILRLIRGPEWAVQGVFTLIAILFILIGAQFVAMGVLGEYIGRTYHDVRARPRYFVEKVVGESQLN